MAVQDYEQHIEPEATQASAPEELHPVAAAFGGDIGAALQHGGEQIASRIEQLTQHMAMMNYYRQQQNIADKVLQMKTAQDNVLFNEDPKEITRNPNIDNLKPGDMSLSADGTAPSNIAPISGLKTFTAPTGLLLRKDNAADGVTQEYHAWATNYSNQMIDQAKAEGMGERAIRSLKIKLDSDFASNARYISGHEAEQLHNGQIKTFTGLMQGDADSANLAQDSQSLGLKIDSINKTAVDLSSANGLYKDDNGNLTEAHLNTTNNFVGQALNNSMSANMKFTNGDPTQFQGILDRLHYDKRITDVQYNKASDDLDKTSRSFIKNSEIEDRTQTVNRRMNIMQLALSGKLDLNNPNTQNEISAQDAEMGTSLSNYNLNKNKDIKDQDESFADATQKIYSAGSKEQISKYTMNVLKEGKISQDRLNILMGAAMDRGKNLADLEGQSKSTNPVQNLIDQGMKVLFGENNEALKKLSGNDENSKKPNAQTLIDYMNSVKEGKTVPEAIQHAQGQEAIRNNPHLLNIPPNGQIFHDKYGNRRIVYPDLHTESIGGKTATKEKDGNSNS